VRVVQPAKHLHLAQSSLAHRCRVTALAVNPALEPLDRNDITAFAVAALDHGAKGALHSSKPGQRDQFGYDWARRCVACCGGWQSVW
jgi:hypothetical protein